jgi:SAM-dependent methyltransferase
MKTINLEQFKVYQERYSDADPPPGGYSKYLDIRTWMAAKLTYLYHLNLHTTRPLRILDLGTGPGYFPYLCSLYGHRVVAIDLDIVPMYNELCKFFHVDRRTWRIVKFENLPDFGVRFDLVTAFMIKFNQHGRPDQWGVNEWRFFLEDLKRNQMAENGRIFLELNACRDGDGSWFDAGLLDLFLDRGGRVYRNHVDIGGPKPNFALDLMDRLLAAKEMHHI